MSLRKDLRNQLGRAGYKSQSLIHPPSKSFTSLQLPLKLRMCPATEIQPHKPTLEQLKRAKSLSNIRLLAASKMRVKPHRPVFKPHLFHPFVRYCPQVCNVKPNSSGRNRQLAINYRSSVPNPMELYHLKGASHQRSSLQSVQLYTVRADIQEQLRKRQNYRKQQCQMKRIQSGRSRTGLVTGSPLKTMRSASANNIRNQTPNNMIVIAPWERLQQPEAFF